MDTKCLVLSSSKLGGQFFVCCLAWDLRHDQEINLHRVKITKKKG